MSKSSTRAWRSYLAATRSAGAPPRAATSTAKREQRFAAARVAAAAVVPIERG